MIVNLFQDDIFDDEFVEYLLHKMNKMKLTDVFYFFVLYIQG